MKKFGLTAVLAAFAFLLVSCGSTNTNMTATKVYGYEKSDIKQQMQQTAEQLNSISAKNARKQEEKYKNDSELAEGDTKNQDVILEGMLGDWADAADKVGDFESFGDFTVTKAGKTITCKQGLDYSKRDAELVFVYTTRGSHMVLTGVNLNLKYTLGETMGRAGMNVLLGMGTVFAILIIICLVIYAFNIIPYLQKKFSEDKQPVEAAVETAREVIPVDNNNDELIAVIAAAVSAYTGESTDDFVVRKIRRRY